LLRIVSLQDVQEVSSIVWDATLSFIALIVISLILDSLGFFEWSALHMIRLSKGNGRRMFIYSIVLGAAVSAIFNNDGAAMILTPIMLAQVRALKLPEPMVLPFVMAGGFIADTTSFPLVISNLVNIVVSDYFHLPFFAYAFRMFLPNLISLGASMGMLFLLYRKSIPQSFDAALLKQPAEAIRSRFLFRYSWLVLALLLAGYALSVWLKLPLSLVAGLAALLLVIPAHSAGVVRIPQVVREAPWHIIIFSIGMYVVVYGLRNVGLTDLLGQAVASFARHGIVSATIGMGWTAALLSSVMNNLPSVLIGTLAIDGIHGISNATREALIYANVIGCDLGPKMTPIGSLATLIWLHILNRKGVRITWTYYMKTGILLTVPTLTLALLGLALQLILLQIPH
jgi:arsenical pump membrane protein